jgi:hypothetical protein
MNRYEIALGKKPPIEKEKSFKVWGQLYSGSWDIADVSNKFDSMVNIADVNTYLDEPHQEQLMRFRDLGIDILQI